jgi:hypothetical protein
MRHGTMILSNESEGLWEKTVMVFEGHVTASGLVKNHKKPESGLEMSNVKWKSVHGNIKT